MNIGGSAGESTEVTIALVFITFHVICRCTYVYVVNSMPFRCSTPIHCQMHTWTSDIVSSRYHL